MRYLCLLLVICSLFVLSQTQAPEIPFLQKLWNNKVATPNYFTKGDYLALKKLNCPTEIPEKDSDSFSAQVQFNEYLNTDETCKKGVGEFDKASDSSQLPDSYMDCIKNFDTKYVWTYFWKYIYICDKTIVKEKKAPETQLPTRLIQDYIDCRNNVARCGSSDTDCQIAEKEYERRKGYYQQCNLAKKEYEKLDTKRNNYPFYMEACEQSVKPFQSNFQAVWEQYQQCEIRFTKGLYEELKLLNCPTEIPSQDSTSYTCYRKYLEYIASDSVCKEGMKEYDNTSENEWLPENYVNCILKFTPYWSSAYYTEYITNCDKAILRTYKTPTLSTRTVQISKYENCRNNVIGCQDDDHQCKVAEQKYNNLKGYYQQCHLAKAEYEKQAINNNAFPYAMHTCEESVEPEERTFNQIWQKYRKCQTQN